MPHTLKQCWRQGVCRCALLCGACAASEIAPRRAPGAELAGLWRTLLARCAQIRVGVSSGIVSRPARC